MNAFKPQKYKFIGELAGLFYDSVFSLCFPVYLPSSMVGIGFLKVFPCVRFVKLRHNYKAEEWVVFYDCSESEFYRTGFL